MTTKPKARKFRIKRAPSVDPSAQTGELRSRPADPAAGVTRRAAAPAAETPNPQAMRQEEPPRRGQVSSATQVSGEQDMDAIRREGLTGRQLRMARRVAQKHGLPATSDFDAVRLLRAKGIDPFQRSNMLELVVPQAGGEQHEGGAGDTFATLPGQTGGAGAGRVQLPQTVPTDREPLPSVELSPMERRMREISDIQADISNRRRKKMGLLLVRLAFFVMIPTFFAGYYFYNIATPLYATDSQFLIIQNEGSGSPGGLGGLLPAQYATSQDSIATQSYLTSKDAMLRLDEDAGFKDHFTKENVDPIQRLNPNPTNEEAYKLYKKNVKIGYDPTEGVIRMEVIAADPQVATQFSERLLVYAEERVNALSQTKREDGMRDARITYDKAVGTRRSAQESLIKLQIENGVDPEAVIAALRTQITNYETIVIEKELELAALLDNSRPNQAKVEGAQADVRRIRAQLVKLNARMINATEGENSLAQQAVNLQLAQADLASADANLQLSLTGLEAARTEANRQVRYLTIAVRPVASEEPSYPRKFENTILAFLVFAGIYLMLSLTTSILREQVTS
ncbi:capsule biosynthesis protein [Sulfitobacter sp. SK012]|uniref:capsule biosynthesis protein n=1 Tax=Sulfitobacter sp. SK012 TaxID=1389005 RepID=UPI000E0BF9F7|nr:capsule biosynthesis protein [Sulfitobacter sp. SK012]AXI47721.1 capsule biosynthesis protein [Sulfitobacter sp. SK012]